MCGALALVNADLAVAGNRGLWGADMKKVCPGV